MNIIEEHKQRFALTLLAAVLVFVIITLAMLLTIPTVYLLIRLGVILSASEGLDFGSIVIFMSLISMLIGFIITMITGKKLLKPVNLIIDRLNRLAKGDFKARLSFGRIVGSHPTFKEIEKSFNCAAEELEHSEFMRSDFTNNFSHEFKTPIVSIAGFAKLLRHGDLTDEQKEEYLAIIEEESLRLSYMATNMLNLTKVENQTILTGVTRFNLSEQIRSAVLLLADKWSQKDLDMDVEFGEHSICANEELLKQVWINLLDNAVKFSEPGSRIAVEITESGNDILVAVSNYGKDIPPESICRIFNKFYQADESHSSEGNGIGLAIVKKICELHGGAVSAESQNGKTTFTVALPRDGKNQ